MASGEIGMACIDLKNPEIDLSQFPDTIGYSRTLLKLYMKDPVEVMISDIYFLYCTEPTELRNFECVMGLIIIRLIWK